MKKNILGIYALAVCFIALAGIVISASITIYSLVGVTMPKITLNPYEYERHESNDSYWREERFSDLYSSLANNGTAVQIIPERPSEDVLSKKRSEGFQLALQREERNMLQCFIQTVIYLLLALLVFFLHWRLIKVDSHVPSKQLS